MHYVLNSNTFYKIDSNYVFKEQFFIMILNFFHYIPGYFLHITSFSSDSLFITHCFMLSAVLNAALCKLASNSSESPRRIVFFI